MQLRPYRPSDLPHLFSICLQTGDSGRDARGIFRDAHLVGRYFAVPYATFDPRLVLILEDPEGPCGYVLGASDTSAYVEWFNRSWLPGLQALTRTESLRAGESDAWLYQLIRKRAVVPAAAARYPAHLHVDLLPRAQGRGWGSRMVREWCWLAAARGATGFHLGVSTTNERAHAFYSRLGLKRLPDAHGAVVFARELPWNDALKQRRPARA